ncbi:MAG: hypothetical protein DRK00_07520 [Thermoprotei archaeon]|nr:MAG: hypothetical protein DRK00_07520 [Thermoprotei archaeon]
MRLCWVAIVLVALCTMPIAVSQRPSIIGLVVDVRGRPIEGVVVEVYRDGVYQASTTTYANGYFTVPLTTPGVYEVILYKKGFEKRVFRIQLRGGALSLGNVTLSYALEVIVEAASIVVQQGDVVAIPVQVRNRGAFAEEVSLAISVPPYWVAEVEDEKGLIVKRVVLPPGVQESYTLTVKVPRNASGSHEMTLALSYSGVSQKVSIHVEVVAREWNLIRLTYPSLVSFPGDLKRIPISLYNSLGEEAEMVIDVIAPEDWGVRVEADGEVVRSLVLEEGERRDLELRIRVPETTSPGRYEVRVMVRALDVVSEKKLMVEVVEGYDEVIVESGAPLVDALAGSTALIELVVMNEGTGSTTVSFDVSGLPLGYRWSLRDEAGNLVSAIHLPAGVSRKVMLAIEIPRGEVPRAVEFTLWAKGGRSEDSIRLGINVKGRPELRIRTLNWIIETFAGTPAKFEIEVENSGQVPISDLAVTVDSSNLPRGVDVKVEPPTVRLLPPGETVTFTLTVLTDPMLPPGRYYVPVSIAGSGVRSDRSLALEVRTRSEYFFLMIALMLVATATVALVARYWRGGWGRHSG